MEEASLDVIVEVQSTEDSFKVKASVYKVFGDLNLKENLVEGKLMLVGKAVGLDGLSSFRSLIRKERIRGAARSVFFKGLRGNILRFYLNKQVAYVGHISFSEPTGESPLGPIMVEIRSENPRDLIDWLTEYQK